MTPDNKSIHSSAIKIHANLFYTVPLLLISAASLCYEINLTRLFSISQFYHFAFMVVSIALLGFGASGTFLALWKKGREKQAGKFLPLYAAASSLCMLGAYLLINHLPFDSYRLAVEPTQILILFLHYAVLASPFLFIGIITGILLSKATIKSSNVYATNMIGSAGGCLIAVIAPAWFGSDGLVILCASIASLAGLIFFIGYMQKAETTVKYRIGSWILHLSMLSIYIFLFGCRAVRGKLPEIFQLKISPYKSLSYALQPPQAEIISSQWNSYSRVDVVSSPSLHSIPGLSYRYLDPLPAFKGLFIDGDNLSTILSSGSNLDFTAYLPASIAYLLRPAADVLLLEPKGGLDIFTASHLGAEEITVTESNPLVINALQQVYLTLGINLVRASGRSFLVSTQSQYDIIHLSLTEGYHPVSSGAYTLGEDYRYTLEAFTAMLQDLKPDGIFVITRWLQEEPSEWLRTFILGVTALEAQRLDPRSRIVALRGYNTGTLLIKTAPFTSDELEKIRSFCEDKAFDLVFSQDIQITEINRYNILPEPIYNDSFMAFLNMDSRNDYYQSTFYDVQPPIDDHPFFNHYFKWHQFSDILDDFGQSWQPFGGAGYLVILIIFILAIILGGILVILPLLVAKKWEKPVDQKQLPLYFGLIGLGFMLVELPLIQRFILYLDQPAIALATVLGCILFFSGLGSRYGIKKVPQSRSIVLLIAILTLYIFLLPKLIEVTLGINLLFRLGFAVMLIAPVGFLMGIPFPAGLIWMDNAFSDEKSAGCDWMVAWVWAINGACSVVGSILASLLSLSFGFTKTTVFGIICYLLAGILISSQRRFHFSQQQNPI